MALISCRECGRPVSTSAAAFPGCGATPKKGISKWWLLLAPALVAAIFGLARTPVSREELLHMQLSDQIRLCWLDQKRESRDSATKRFAAEACEMLERQYEEKYGRRP